MIFWISSYPKSGNTWLRALLSSYYFTVDGYFKNDLILRNVDQFPQKKYLTNFSYDSKVPGDTSKVWIQAQKKINIDKKIKFFKTHNALIKLGDNDFTNEKLSIGGIYIVRDPRNVITSLSNHYELSNENALNFMLGEKKYIYDFYKKNDFSDFQLISSWEKNYRSWKNYTRFPVKFIRYEDLAKNTFLVFEEIINFIDMICEYKKKFDKQKAENSILSTSFEKLKNLEMKKGFLESVSSKTNQKKIPFFHLGPNNKWQKNFDKKFLKKINNIFEKNLIELNY